MYEWTSEIGRSVFGSDFASERTSEIGGSDLASERTSEIGGSDLTSERTSVRTSEFSPKSDVRSDVRTDPIFFSWLQCEYNVCER